MTQTFVQPRFVGARFDQHTLPLEVARDLAAYETLVVELAKHLYLSEHPNRQRVPRGFMGEFQLHLSAVEAGSARPILAWVAAGALTLSGGSSSYLDLARDLVAECVAADVSALPAKFSKDLLTHFNQFGRSLHDGEALELARRGEPAAVLTPDKRKRLVLAADQVYEKEVRLEGLVGQVDWDQSSFRLRLAAGGQMQVPMPDHFREKARHVGGRQRSQVVVSGIGAFDSWDKLQKVVHVESIDVQPNFAIAARLKELGTLSDGWFDGSGKALNRDALGLFAETFTAIYPEELPLPLIVPTPEGNILLEWNVSGSPSVDVELATREAQFHAFRDGGDVEQTFNFSEDHDWDEFLAVLNANLPKGQA